jgi:hypothetical protein
LHSEFFENPPDSFRTTRNLSIQRDTLFSQFKKVTTWNNFSAISAQRGITAILQFHLLSCNPVIHPQRKAEFFNLSKTPAISI